ncbi:MAG: addiction module antitoxin RelB [Deltaproteobacteria bacterium]|nr:addiction module antitoxin RelB [Deltaproteobacteria bacterium]
MVYTIRYHLLVKEEDLPKLDNTIKARIRKAIETRLMVAPEEYGEPLRRTLKGYWKRRVGDYRVVFKVEGTEITILGIRHRRDVYEVMAGSRAEK